MSSDPDENLIPIPFNAYKRLFDTAIPGYTTPHPTSCLERMHKRRYDYIKFRKEMHRYNAQPISRCHMETACPLFCREILWICETRESYRQVHGYALAEDGMRDRVMGAKTYERAVKWVCVVI